MNQKLNHSETKQKARLQYISENGIYQTQTQMAQSLKVSRSTIQRDLEVWYDTNGFKQLIIAKFLENYGKAERTEKPIKLLDRIITMFKYLPVHTQAELSKDILVSFNLEDKYSVSDEGSITLKPTVTSE